MPASYSSVLRGKEEKGFPPPHKLFPGHGFAMEEQKKKVQDFNLTGTGTSGYEEQSADGLKKVKANWGNDLIFGLSEHSASSGLSSPFGSELGSTETDETESEEDEDFIAQLTRQMADYMLKDDEEEEDLSVDENDVDENIALNSTPSTVQTSSTYGLAGNWPNYNSREICHYNQESLGTYVQPVADSVNYQMKSSNTVFYSSDDLKRPIQVYHLKDQPTAAKQKPKRVKGTTTESIQKPKTEKNNTQSSLTKKQTLVGHGQCKDKIRRLHPHHPIQGSGAGMRAIFLGGSSSINGPSGTGVFLPRTNNNPNPPPTATTEPKKKKSGSSTVVIPARVLQALQQHFNHMDALSQSNTCHASITNLPKNDVENEAEDLVSKENQHSEDQTSVINDQETQLPQEWTY